MQDRKPCSIIVFNESLYYVEDALDTLRRVSQYLAPEGVLLISMFERLVTSRIWKLILPHYRVLRSVRIEDATWAKSWRIRVLQPL
ncbi:MAG: methyltransferase domain-containing protein [Limisphaerales bacterium]